MSPVVSGSFSFLGGPFEFELIPLCLIAYALGVAVAVVISTAVQARKERKSK